MPNYVCEKRETLERIKHKMELADVLEIQSTGNTDPIKRLSETWQLPRTEEYPLLSCSTRKTKPCHNTHCDKPHVLTGRCYACSAHSSEKYHFLSDNAWLLQSTPCASPTFRSLSSQRPIRQQTMTNSPWFSYFPFP